MIHLPEISAFLILQESGAFSENVKQIYRRIKACSLKLGEKVSMTAHLSACDIQAIMELITCENPRSWIF